LIFPWIQATEGGQEAITQESGRTMAIEGHQPRVTTQRVEVPAWRAPNVGKTRAEI